MSSCCEDTLSHEVSRKEGGQARSPVTTLRTVRLRGMETGISEASKRVSIFSFATQGGKRVSIFDRGTGSKPEMLRSGSLRADLNLIV